jgi:hypothetical protein
MFAKFSVGDTVRIARDTAIRMRLARGYGSVPEGTIVKLRAWDPPEVPPSPIDAAAAIAAGKGRDVHTACGDGALAIVEMVPPDGLNMPLQAVFVLGELEPA